MNHLTLNKLKDLSDARGFKTNTELAAAAGLTEGAIRGYMTGRRLPKPLYAIKLAHVLQISVDDLYEILGVVDDHPLPKHLAGSG